MSWLTFLPDNVFANDMALNISQSVSRSVGWSSAVGSDLTRAAVGWSHWDMFICSAQRLNLAHLSLMRNADRSELHPTCHERIFRPSFYLKKQSPYLKTDSVLVSSRVITHDKGKTPLSDFQYVEVAQLAMSKIWNKTLHFLQTPHMDLSL